MKVIEGLSNLKLPEQSIGTTNFKEIYTIYFFQMIHLFFYPEEMQIINGACNKTFQNPDVLIISSSIVAFICTRNIFQFSVFKQSYYKISGKTIISSC